MSTPAGVQRDILAAILQACRGGYSESMARADAARADRVICSTPPASFRERARQEELRLLMPRQGPDEPDDSENDDEPLPDRRRALLMLVFVLVLVAGGLLLVRVLHNMAQIQDCAMSGRTNCAPIDVNSSSGR